ncbi:hypothetical protein AADZ86_16740 [Colwelliaceae bacterium BS250]
MDYKRLAQLTDKVLLKVNSNDEWQEYVQLHEQLDTKMHKNRWQLQVNNLQARDVN